MKNKNLLYALLLFLFAGIISSCSKDDDNGLAVDEEWKKRNEAVFQEVIDSREYIPYVATNNAGSIYVRVIDEGTGTDPILHMDSVWVYYDLYLADETDIYQSVQHPDNPPARLLVREVTSNNPYQDGIISGFYNALLRMKVGDEWEVWMPQQLAYGKAGYGTGDSAILPYTTLRYIIKVERHKRN